MGDDRSRVEKLQAMAAQTASPNEAAIAARMLEGHAAKDPMQGPKATPHGQLYTFEIRRVDLYEGVGTASLLTHVVNEANRRGIPLRHGSFVIRERDDIISVSFLVGDPLPAASPVGPAPRRAHVVEVVSTNSAFGDDPYTRTTSTTSGSAFGGFSYPRTTRVKTT